MGEHEWRRAIAFLPFPSSPPPSALLSIHCILTFLSPYPRTLVHTIPSFQSPSSLLLASCFCTCYLLRYAHVLVSTTSWPQPHSLSYRGYIFFQRLLLLYYYSEEKKNSAFVHVLYR